MLRMVVNFTAGERGDFCALGRAACTLNVNNFRRKNGTRKL